MSPSFSLSENTFKEKRKNKLNTKVKSFFISASSPEKIYFIILAINSSQTNFIQINIKMGIKNQYQEKNSLKILIQHAVLDGFGDMDRANSFFPAQVSNCSGNF